MLIHTAGICHPGKVRDRNEDTCVLDGAVVDRTGEKTIFFKRNIVKVPLFAAVFDGMGGISAGDVASALSAEAAQSVLSRAAEFENADTLMRAIITDANDKVCKEMLSTRKRMGSTAAMLYFDRRHATLCNLGDSPIFLLRNRELTEIFEVHNERAAYEKEHGPVDRHKKFRLTRHIGIFPQEMTLQPYVNEIPLKSGDRFLICSDGLTDMVEPEEITELLTKGDPPEDTVKQLLDRALENGGKDNVSILLTEIPKNRFPAFSLKIFNRKSG